MPDLFSTSKMRLAMIVAVPAAIFMAAVLRYSVNIPIYDDMTQILWVVNAFIEGHVSPGTPPGIFAITDRLHAIFYPNAGHVPMVTRLFALAQYYLTGHVNFYWATVICCLIWVMTAIFMLRIFYRDGTPVDAILALPFLLFSLSQWEAMTMMLGSIQMYIGTLLFPILTLYALTVRKPVVAAICFFFGLFSSGGALGLLPLAAAYLLWHRQWRSLVIFISFALLFVPIFYHLNEFGHIKDPAILYANIPGRITYILYFLSNLTANGSYALELMVFMTKVNLVVGGVLAALGIFCVFGTSGHHFAKLIVAYIVLLAVMTSVMRTTIAPRYGALALIYASAVYAILSTWYYKRLKPNKAAVLNACIFALTLGVWANNCVMAIQPLNFNREIHIQDMQDYIRTGNAKDLMWDPAWCVDILNVSRRLGVYDYQDLKEPINLPGIRKTIP